MIVIKANDEKEEQEIAAILEQTLKDRDIDIFQNDTAEYSLEDVLSYLTYNTKQVRVYVGRLERNTRRIEEDIRHLGGLLQPMSSLAELVLNMVLDDEEGQFTTLTKYDAIRRRAQRTPKVIGTIAEKITNT